jgi:hypothetical protein
MELVAIETKQGTLLVERAVGSTPGESEVADISKEAVPAVYQTNVCCARWSGLSGIYVLAEALLVFASHSKSKRCGTSAMTAEGLEDYDRGIVGRFGTRSNHTDMLQYIAVVDRSTLFAHSFRIGRN